MNYQQHNNYVDHGDQMVFNKTTKKIMKIKTLIGMNCAGRVATSTILQVGQNVSNAMHPENPAEGHHILPSLRLHMV